jgi:hypothetical protein
LPHQLWHFLSHFNQILRKFFIFLMEKHHHIACQPDSTRFNKVQHTFNTGSTYH